MLNDREIEIMNVIIDVWDDNGARHVGDVSYAEIFELFDKLGLKRPQRLSAFILEVDGKLP